MIDSKDNQVVVLIMILINGSGNVIVERQKRGDFRVIQILLKIENLVGKGFQVIEKIQKEENLNFLCGLH